MNTKRKDYGKEWRERNPKYSAKNAKKWRENNREKYLEGHREHRARPEYKLQEKERTINERRNKPLKTTLKRARDRSKLKKIKFNLTMEYLESIWTGICPVFNIEIIAGAKKGSIPNINIASLDRIDNTKGYIIGNVHFISYKANIMKNDATFSEIEMIYNWYSEQK